jgi:hypothetical protein
MRGVEQAIDDRGNDQNHGREMLRNLIDHGFKGNLEGAAVALGWPQEKLQQHLSGEATVDDDLVMKMRGIARERSFDIE